MNEKDNMIYIIVREKDGLIEEVYDDGDEACAHHFRITRSTGEKYRLECITPKSKCDLEDLIC